MEVEAAASGSREEVEDDSMEAVEDTEAEPDSKRDKLELDDPRNHWNWSRFLLDRR